VRTSAYCRLASILIAAEPLAWGHLREERSWGPLTRAARRSHLVPDSDVAAVVVAVKQMKAYSLPKIQYCTVIQSRVCRNQVWRSNTWYFWFEAIVLY